MYYKFTLSIDIWKTINFLLEKQLFIITSCGGLHIITTHKHKYFFCFQN